MASPDNPKPDNPALDNPALDNPALDNPAWHALRGPQAALALGTGAARRFHPDVGVFSGLPDDVDETAWDALATVTNGGIACVFRVGGVHAPPGWQTFRVRPGRQMVATSAIGRPDPAFARLGRDDVDDMLDLVARTQPGPFFRRTIECGTYLGWRDPNGRLVAMAGERLHFPGFTEISAVCTDETARRQGLGGRLVRAVAAGIEARGETPMLHLSADNTGAQRLYEALGFAVRAEVDFVLLRPPA